MIRLISRAGALILALCLLWTGVSGTAVELPEESPAAHSDLYLPEVSVEDVILYFNEVCLDAEFVDSGDPSKLQKWADPILYICSGDCTETDRETLDGFVQWLNTIEGFPGIEETDDFLKANMSISFREDEESYLALMGDHLSGTDGGVRFWYDGENRIYDAMIGYRMDVDQEVRRSVILEEIYNGLGPIQDTDLREDSLIYSGYTVPQSLSPVDELILKLLYHPEMQCGMDAAACEAVIRRLYY